MNNYKIKVNSKYESKEVQELLEVIGYEKGACSLGSYPAVIVTTQDWATGSYCSTRALGLDIPAHDNYIEVTLAELRDMIVLKRNDVNDATHENNFFKYVELTDGWYYFEDKWQKSAGAKPEYYEKLKPIEKNMKKEYLDAKRNYEFVVSIEKDDGFIEIPEGSNYAYNNDMGLLFMPSEIGFNHPLLAWQRPTQPEELPFIDDEPQSLNDQYAEIEQVRQHSHYKKDVSNLEFVDVYRVLKLFDVTDPCLQHAIKKLLCSGQRGAKSSDQDIQEAIDSLVRFQQMRIEDTLD